MKTAVLGVMVGLGALVGAAGIAAASPAYTVSSFTARGFDNTYPGEPSVAVGRKYVVETTNTEMTVYTKSGTQTSHHEFSSFFSGASTPFCADPVTVYSKAVNRYAIVCTDISSNATTRFAVSKTGNANGGWYKWSAGANTDVDQPSIEFTSDKLIVIGSGPFSCGSGCGTQIWAYQLSDLLAGKTSPRVTSFNVPRGQYRAAVQISSAGSGYLVQGFPGDHLYLGRVSGTPGAGDVAFTETDLGADKVSPPHEPSIPGGLLGGGDLDGRVTMASYELTAAKNKIIEFSQMAKCGSLDCNVDGRIKLTSAKPTLSYLKTSPTKGFDQTYGAVVPDGNGWPLMGYTRSSPTQSPQAAVMAVGLNRVVRNAKRGVSACGTVPARVRRAPTPLGLGPVVAAPASSSSCDMRWGDYLGAAQDPTNPQRVWLSGLYQTASGAAGFTTVITSITVIR